ncbi:hypothetical protein ACQHIV_15855 [Kribbella sp. GL6]
MTEQQQAWRKALADAAAQRRRRGGRRRRGQYDKASGVRVPAPKDEEQGQ